MHTVIEPEQSIGETPLYVRWNPDRSPYLIEMRLDLVSRIAREIANAKGREIGGLLFGTAPTAENQILRVDDFEAIPAPDGRSYTLDPELQDKFAEMRWAGNNRRHAVGFFRSTSRPGVIRPSIGDQSLVSTQFKEGIAAILLISAKIPNKGVFYVVRNGEIPDEPSVQEFLFDHDSFSALPEIEPNSAAADEETPPSLLAIFKTQKWLGVAAAGLLLCVLAFFLTVRGHASGALHLTVRPANNVLEISWNHSDTQVKHALDGILTVTDGAKEKQVHLGGDELKMGSVDYQTNSQRVKVSLALNVPGSVPVPQSAEWGSPQ